MKNYSKILADNITFYRKKKGLTQEALAKKLGISFQAVSKWENEQSCPDILMLPLLAEIFEISIGTFFSSDMSDNSGDTEFRLSWPDDEILRAAVFKGHELLENCDDISKFTFTLNGDPLNVISYCNIVCEEIRENATASNDIKCEGDIGGNASAGNNISCVGDINGVTSAGNNIKCDGDINGNANAGNNLTCEDIHGTVIAGNGINCGSISG
ncbi:MAG: helix-turn-helix domain-containing protein [Clostridia bacterium]|nr:helix-turn-helix domain-containing protein [Clostridia bacterium]